MSDPQTTNIACDLAVRIVEQSHRHYLRKADWGSEDFKGLIQDALDEAFNAGFQKAEEVAADGTD